LACPRSRGLAEFNRFLARALARVRISRGKGIFAWDFLRFGAELDPILAEVVWSAQNSDLAELNSCASGEPDCGWLFVDREPEEEPPWCEMQGMRKPREARRYYRRHSAGTRSKGSTIRRVKTLGMRRPATRPPSL